MSVSILNDVIGPIMRGPSSSHTAGPYFIGAAVRQMLGQRPRQVTISFDPGGSFARVYRDQKSDVGFAAGLFGLEITDERFGDSLALAAREGLAITFGMRQLGGGHPNAVLLEAVAGDGRQLAVQAASIGGGQIRIDGVDGAAVEHDARRRRVLVVAPSALAMTMLQEELSAASAAAGLELAANPSDATGKSLLVQAQNAAAEPALDAIAVKARAREGVKAYVLPAAGLAAAGKPETSLGSVREALQLAGGTDGAAGSLAHAGRTYEAAALGLTGPQLDDQMRLRWKVMQNSIDQGLGSSAKMRFLSPTAAGVMEAAKAHGAIDTVLGQATAAALAVMESNSAGSVVCAAPTGGSAGVIAGVLWAYSRHKPTTDHRQLDALWAAGVVGAMVAQRATFAAEVCGCAAEVGVGAAMAAAALVELEGGSPKLAMEAAALCLMNMLGLVCDPVRGAVEIPCHGRNIAGVGVAVSCAQAVLGGFRAVLPLDEVIDAMLQVGVQIPPSLRCTSQGGLAATLSAGRL